MAVKDAVSIHLMIPNGQTNNELNEKSGEGTDPYYGEKHDMENKKIENLGNMTWANFKK